AALLHGERRFFDILVVDKGDQGDDPGALDSDGQLALMPGAGAGNPSGDDLRSFRQDLAAVFADGLVIDVLDLINTESADFSAGLSAAVVSFHGSRLLSTELR